MAVRIGHLRGVEGMAMHKVCVIGHFKVANGAGRDAVSMAHGAGGRLTASTSGKAPRAWAKGVDMRFLCVLELVGAGCVCEQQQQQQ